MFSLKQQHTKKKYAKQQAAAYSTFQKLTFVKHNVPHEGIAYI